MMRGEEDGLEGRVCAGPFVEEAIGVHLGEGKSFVTGTRVGTLRLRTRRILHEREGFKKVVIEEYDFPRN